MRRPLAGVGDGISVPERLTDALSGGVDRVVWVNEVGGVTVAGRLEGRPVYAKWAPAGTELDLGAEAIRLDWARAYLTVPEVVCFDSFPDGEILITHALHGRNAVDSRWVAEPERAVRALGSGLRALHDAMPVGACPFSWSVEDRIGRARTEGPRHRLPLLDRLPAAPEPDLLVVCHADACAPNTLLGDDGRVTGYVDLGRLGVADRWADIAIGAWSTEWNYGEGFTGLYYESYGVEPDQARIDYYRALWDAT